MAKVKPKAKRIKNLKALQALHYRNWRRDYPNMPDYSYPTKAFSQKNANEVTKTICHYINYRGGVANRINNGAVYDRKLGKYRKGGVTKGVPDIDATYQGKAIKIEVKFGRDTMSPDQLRLKSRYEKAGAHYFIARDFDRFYDWFVGIFGRDEVE